MEKYSISVKNLVLFLNKITQIKTKCASFFDVSNQRRHLELINMALVVFCEILLGATCVFIILCLLFFGNIYARAICILYVAFIYYDRQTGDRGGRGVGTAWMRNLSVWKHCKNYFPVDLVKTVDLPPNRNYLLCAFPHGLLSLGIGINFGTNHSKWSTLFPGIRAKCTTLGFTFHLPVQREILLNCGFCSASENSVNALLNQSNDPFDASNSDGFTSNAAVLVVGGVREAFHTQYTAYKCVLKNRRGFVRLALQAGASLVPVISFGETNLYEIIDYKPGTWMRSIQDTIKRYTYIVPIHFNGLYNFGLLPKRHPITTVIGAPIHIKRTEHPSEDELNRLHAIFCKRLTELFETHKCKYVKNYEKIQLEII